MKLLFYKHQSHKNFGDDLNEWLWPKLLDNFFDENEDVLFLGIGSILGTRKAIESKSKKIVFGSGYVDTYHNDKPNVNDDSWDVFFVRGPRTAKALNLSKDKSLGDAAILIRNVVNYENNIKKGVGYIPHFLSLDRGDWKKVCEMSNVKLIDPRAEVDVVIEQILGCEYVITEAMHGAIVADALRVPWIAVMPFDQINRDKWYDWSESLELQLTLYNLFPSSIEEYRKVNRHKKLIHLVAYILSKSFLSKLLNPFFETRAAKSLSNISKYRTSLSKDEVITSVNNKMNEHLTSLLKKYKK